MQSLRRIFSLGLDAVDERVCHELSAAPDNGRKPRANLTFIYGISGLAQ